MGELGPADLTTLVLQPESKLIDYKYPDIIVTTGYIVALLVEYTVDPNIHVVKAASEALCDLSCKVGKTVIGNTRVFVALFLFECS